MPKTGRDRGPAARPAWVRYASGVGVVAAALALAAALRTFDLEGFLFVIAVAVAVWIGGRGPGLLAVVLSVVVLHYFFVAPQHTGSLLPTTAYFVLFSVLAAVMTALSEARHRAERDVVLARDDLEKKVEERTDELQRSETFLMEAQRLSHTGSWRTHLKTRAMYWSPEHYRIMGFDPSIAAPPVEWSWRRVHPEDLERVKQIVDSGLRDKKDVEYENRIVRPDGSIRSIVNVLHPVVDASGEVVELIGTCVDITERRADEAEIRKQAELLSLAHDALIVRDDDGLIRFWNHGAEEIYCWTPEEALGKRSHALLRTEFPIPLEEIEAITRERGRWEGELVHMRRDGARLVVASRWSQQRDERGRAVAVLETNTDITARKRADEEVRRSEHRYRNIFEMAGVAILEQDYSKVTPEIEALRAQGVRNFRAYVAEHPEFVRRTLELVRVTDANQAAIALFRARSKEEFMQALPQLTTREVEEAWAAVQLPAIAEGRSSVESEVVLTTIQGEKLTALVTIVLPAESSGFDNVLVTVTDLTERNRAQEALQQARDALAHVTRVTTLGELTASIAHEVNQPLAAIVNNANASLALLSEERPDLAEVHAALGDIRSDADRAGAIIQRVRALAARAPSERVPLRLPGVVGDVVALAAAEAAARRVTIRCEVAEDLPLVAGDRVQLHQVLLNLVVNGMDAMASVPDGAHVLEIRGRRVLLDGTLAATLSVRDYGIGLAGADASRLFDAFYTTKPHGMGMGLAISRSIIESHGGRLFVEPQPGPGATFSFTLPAVTP